ncbi:MAG: hypothetical protein EOM18_14820 [Clostridia bacterium]|nr:hypothetical protein [Clostridia bacterium]
MKQLSTRNIAIISLVAIAILAVGVFVTQKKEVPSEIPVPVVENGENQGESPENLENGEEIVKVDENFMSIAIAFDVSDWQLYSNEELGFSVKIPSTFDLNDPRIYEDEEWELKNICFPDNQDIQHYQNEGEENTGPRLLCFRKAILEGNMTTEELMDAWKNSSNQFVNYDITISHNIPAKLYFGYSDGIAFDLDNYHWSVQDSYSFNSATVFDDVSKLYYLGIIKTFESFDGESGGI